MTEYVGSLALPGWCLLSQRGAFEPHGGLREAAQAFSVGPGVSVKLRRTATDTAWYLYANMYVDICIYIYIHTFIYVYVCMCWLCYIHTYM